MKKPRERIIPSLIFEDRITGFVQSLKRVSPDTYLFEMAGHEYLIHIGGGLSNRRDEISLGEVPSPREVIREVWFSPSGDNIYCRKRMTKEFDWIEIPPVYLPAPYVPPLPKIIDRDGFQVKNHRNDGHVYFILDEHAGIVKIGCSKNALARLRELQVSHHHDLKIIYTIPTRYMKRKERGLHSKFKKYRIRGEWFSYCDEIKNWILSDKDINTKIRMSTAGTTRRIRKYRPVSGDKGDK
jgi:hypothetical protein